MISSGSTPPWLERFLRVAAWVARFVLRQEHNRSLVQPYRSGANSRDGGERVGRALGENADPAILDLHDRLWRVLNVEYVQQQAIANKKQDRKTARHYGDDR
jgi:hypothetical protein